MSLDSKRIGVMVSGPYVAGLQAVFTGIVRAAAELGWEVAGILDGFEGILFPEKYPEGGLVHLTPGDVENISALSGGLLGSAGRTDPFRVQVVNGEGVIEEKDRSDGLLDTIRKEGLDAVISIVGPEALAVSWKLSRKGLPMVCIPVAVENDVAATSLSFGFNSALTYLIDTAGRAREAAKSLGRIAVVETLGRHAGWLALQSGIGTSADAVLIPEIPYDLGRVAASLGEREKAGWPLSLVIVSEGAAPAADQKPLQDQERHVMERSGLVAQNVAGALQRLTGHETFTIVPGSLIRGGAPTGVDRQLGMGFGAGAVRALSRDQHGVMVAFHPPDLAFVPLADAVNNIRTIPLESEFILAARSMGIALGD